MDRFRKSADPCGQELNPNLRLDIDRTFGDRTFSDRLCRTFNDRTFNDRSERSVAADDFLLPSLCRCVFV